MPPYIMISPAKMKNGMARNENGFMPEIICWKPTARGKPSYRMVASEDRPIENATGTPSSNRSVKLTHRMVNAMMKISVGVWEWRAQCQAGSTSVPRTKAMMCSMENSDTSKPATAGGTYLNASEMPRVGIL